MPGGPAILLEAKSHISELMSTVRAASNSRAMIEAAFNEVARAWNISEVGAWFDPYYQYANRLAHAFLLNDLNEIPTVLVFLYLVGDRQMNGPNSRAAWEAELANVRLALGVTGKRPAYIRDAFVDVSGAVPVAV